jgi:hypothetical protein
MTDVIREEIAKLAGPQDDDAFHRLSEMPSSIVSDLIDAYRTENNSQIRARLVHIIWQHRSPVVLEFLFEALGDRDDECWKQALDGIVATGGPDVVELLVAKRSEATRIGRVAFADWLDEAIEQLQSTRHQI